MKLGIVGLPNVGKSTLFNSLTKKAGAESANYPFCTIDPNVGIVPVPDQRIKLLGDFYSSKKVTPAVVEFVDIAGLVKGASKEKGWAISSWLISGKWMLSYMWFVVLKMPMWFMLTAALILFVILRRLIWS